MASCHVPADFLPTPGEQIMPWLTWKRGFRNHLEEEGNCVVEAFDLAGPPISATQDEFQVLLSALDAQFASARNVIVEGRKFVTRVQGLGETILKYLGALRRLASFCSYGEALESHVAQMFISHIRSTEMQDRLIRESGGANAPSLERAVQLVQQFERTSRDYNLFRRLSGDQDPNASHVVDRIQDGRYLHPLSDQQAQNGESCSRSEGSPPPPSLSGCESRQRLLEEKAVALFS
ncbi:hypothetical protein HPB47_005267 [Ixodes persulcatus]|uniref:Uncharacterized protein n=1 Tax=Ixodes persulcatus TaxID=34615 RepID=A0AC60PDV8_IXOPE|nr:hypothetical protein HPB47_005267 [Ixodes persulcatus]